MTEPDPSDIKPDTTKDRTKPPPWARKAWAAFEAWHRAVVPPVEDEALADLWAIHDEIIAPAEARIADLERRLREQTIAAKAAIDDCEAAVERERAAKARAREAERDTAQYQAAYEEASHVHEQALAAAREAGREEGRCEAARQAGREQGRGRGPTRGPGRAHAGGDERLMRVPSNPYAEAHDRRAAAALATARARAEGYACGRTVGYSEGREAGLVEGLNEAAMLVGMYGEAAESAGSYRLGETLGELSDEIDSMARAAAHSPKSTEPAEAWADDAALVRRAVASRTEPPPGTWVGQCPSDTCDPPGWRVCFDDGDEQVAYGRTREDAIAGAWTKREETLARWRVEPPEAAPMGGAPEPPAPSPKNTEPAESTEGDDDAERREATGAARSEGGRRVLPSHGGDVERQGLPTLGGGRAQAYDGHGNERRGDVLGGERGRLTAKPPEAAPMDGTPPFDAFAGVSDTALLRRAHEEAGDTGEGCNPAVAAELGRRGLVEWTSDDEYEEDTGSLTAKGRAALAAPEPPAAPTEPSVEREARAASDAWASWSGTPSTWGGLPDTARDGWRCVVRAVLHARNPVAPAAAPQGAGPTSDEQMHRLRHVLGWAVMEQHQGAYHDVGQWLRLSLWAMEQGKRVPLPPVPFGGYDMPRDPDDAVIAWSTEHDWEEPPAAPSASQGGPADEGPSDDEIRAILASPHGRRWTIQGFGMLRTYLTDDERVRLHVWSRADEVPGVSVIHDHPWDFTSRVVSGVVRNVRYMDGGHEPHWTRSIVCGPGGCALGTSERVMLGAFPDDVHGPGDTYSQAAPVLHASYPSDGAVTVITRCFGAERDVARVCWPDAAGPNGWVSAEPRDATPEEIERITRHALARWQPTATPPHGEPESGGAP